MPFKRVLCRLAFTVLPSLKCFGRVPFPFTAHEQLATGKVGIFGVAVLCTFEDVHFFLSRGKENGRRVDVSA